MLREYFTGVPIESLARRYGYSEKKIRELAEGCEIMMGILKDEYGIDLSKKVEAEQSRNSKKGIRK